MRREKIGRVECIGTSNDIKAQFSKSLDKVLAWKVTHPETAARWTPMRPQNIRIGNRVSLVPPAMLALEFLKGAARKGAAKRRDNQRMERRGPVGAARSVRADFRMNDSIQFHSKKV